MASCKKQIKRIRTTDKVLLKLAQKKTVLLRQEISGKGICWCLSVRRGADEIERQAIVDDAVVLKLRGLGHIEVTPLIAKLTCAGHIAIRRQMVSGGDCFGQHQNLGVQKIKIGGGERLATVNLSESPLSWLFTRKDKDGRPFIECHQFESGERLRADYGASGMSQKLTNDWDGFFIPRQKIKRGSFDGLSVSERAMAARQRVRAAVEAVGPELGGILIDICCFQLGIEDAEKQNGWPKRTGKINLGLALTRLARHYGLLGDKDNLVKGNKKIQHWGANDYRPTLDGWNGDDEDSAETPGYKTGKT